jgi:hypothetical protein
MVVHVTRDTDTHNIQPSADDREEPAAGEPVGRVNLPDALEADEPSAAQQAVALPFDHDSLRQKILFGVIAVLLMALALIVMLQGVFEQKLPV